MQNNIVDPIQERIKLINRLSSLPGSLFDSLIVAIKPQAGVVSGNTAPQAQRVSELVSWAESELGRGIDNLRRDLDLITKHKPLDSPSPVEEHKTAPTQVMAKLINLPERNELFFTGREKVLKDLVKLFDTNKPVKYAVSGLSGMGKTELVLEYCYLYADKYQFVLWANAEKQEVLDLSYLNISKGLALPQIQTQDSKEVILAVKAWLATHPNWLLVLDNLESQTINFLNKLDDYLPAQHQGHILITTVANTLGRFAQTIPLDKMDTKDSVLLLLKRSTQIDSIDATHKSNQPTYVAAQQIATEMDGLPLAIDQAGAYIQSNSISLESYLTLYKNAKDATKLRKIRGNNTDTHLSVSATFSMAFDKVKPKSAIAIQILQTCSLLSPELIPEEIFSKAGSLVANELRVLVDEPLILNEAIEILLGYSLIKREPNNKTLSIHHLVQAVMLDSMEEEATQSLLKNLSKALTYLCPNSGEDLKNWPTCQRLLPSALTLSKWVKDRPLLFENSINLFHQLSIYCQLQGLFDQASNLAFATLEISKTIPSIYNYNSIAIFNNIGEAYRRQDRYAQALDYYNLALDAVKQIPQLSKEEQLYIAIALGNKGNVYDAQSKYELALEQYELSLSIRKQLLDSPHHQIAQLLSNIGLVYMHKKIYAEALNYFHQSLEQIKQLSGEHSLSVAETIEKIGIVYSDQDKYELALEQYNLALAIKKDILGKDHFYLASTFNNIGIVYARQAKYPEALTHYKLALSISKKTLGNTHSEVANTLNNISTVYRYQKEYEKALKNANLALNIYKQIFGELHVNVAAAFHSIGNIYFEQGDPLQALNYYSLALAIRKQIYGDNHITISDTLNNIGLVYFSLGKYIEAENNYKETLKIREKLSERRSLSNAGTLTNLGNLYETTSREEEALNCYQEALSIYSQASSPNLINVLKLLNSYTFLLLKIGKNDKVETLIKQPFTPEIDTPTE